MTIATRATVKMSKVVLGRANVYPRDGINYGLPEPGPLTNCTVLIGVGNGTLFQIALIMVMLILARVSKASSVPNSKIEMDRDLWARSLCKSEDSIRKMVLTYIPTVSILR